MRVWSADAAPPVTTNRGHDLLAGTLFALAAGLMWGMVFVAPLAARNGLTKPLWDDLHRWLQLERGNVRRVVPRLATQSSNSLVILLAVCTAPIRRRSGELPEPH